MVLDVHSDRVAGTSHPIREAFALAAYRTATRDDDAVHVLIARSWLLPKDSRGVPGCYHLFSDCWYVDGTGHIPMEYRTTTTEVTTILAYGDGKEHVWMGADAMTNVYTRPILSARKIVRKNVACYQDVEAPCDALLGVAGDGGLLALIQASDDIPKLLNIAEAESPDAWAQRVAEYVTRLALDNSIVDDGRMDGSVLLGFHGRVWTVTHMFAVSHPDNIGAIGSGEGPAIGAFDVLLDVKNMGLFGPQLGDTANMIRSAIQTAKYRDMSTGGNVFLEVA